MSHAAVKIQPPTEHVKRRRSFPIHGYVGANGGGKTLCMVLDTLPTLAAGRTVLGTVRLLDPATGEPHPLWEPLDEPRKLAEAYRCDVLIDEVAGVASSRQSTSMPNVIETNLQQMRRGDVCIRWTAPSWKRADTIMRECSQAVTICRPTKFRQQEVEHDDGTARMWTSKSLFRFKTFDADEFEEWSLTQKEKLRPKVKQWFWRPDSVASKAYDTFAPVLRWGLASETGRCINCGGRKSIPKCECGTHTGPLYGGAQELTVVTIAETDETPAVSFELPTADASQPVLS